MADRMLQVILKMPGDVGCIHDRLGLGPLTFQGKPRRTQEDQLEVLRSDGEPGVSLRDHAFGVLTGEGDVPQEHMRPNADRFRSEGDEGMALGSPHGAVMQR